MPEFALSPLGLPSSSSAFPPLVNRAFVLGQFTILAVPIIIERRDARCAGVDDQGEDDRLLLLWYSSQTGPPTLWYA